MEKLARPQIVEGKTIKVVTGCGNMYVTLNRNDSGKLIEVFAVLGKNGGCSRCQNEALTRAITAGLRHGVPVDEYIKELSGLQCPNPSLWPTQERALSCPDAIAKTLKEYGNESP